MNPLRYGDGVLGFQLLSSAGTRAVLRPLPCFHGHNCKMSQQNKWLLVVYLGINQKTSLEQLTLVVLWFAARHEGSSGLLRCGGGGINGGAGLGVEESVQCTCV